MRRSYADRLVLEAGSIKGSRAARPPLRKADAAAATLPARILRLQRLAGNAAVTELLEKRDGVGRSGELEDIEPAPVEKNLCESPVAGDRAQPLTPTLSPRVGRGRSELPVRAEINLELGDAREREADGKSDAVKENLSTGNKVTHGGDEPDDTMFGAEKAAYQAKDISYKETKSDAGDTLEVKSTMFLDIYWNTHSLGRKDVAGPNSAQVTRASYGDIVSDLTPDATGRPLRSKYWAADLTSKHEQFHATDDIAQANLYLPTLKAWMNTKTASATNASVAALVEQARGKIEADGWDHYHHGGEDRAYADGKASYQDRVDKISARATKEGWE